jgi:two-component system chemotaxis response regulator CheY
MPSILVVENDSTIRNLLMLALRYDGYEVAGARDGQEALERYSMTGFDLVVTDIEMPRLDGLALIRALTRECASTKIIAMSGGTPTAASDGGGPLDVAKKLGARRVLQKPIEVHVLLDVVRDELGAGR